MAYYLGNNRSCSRDRGSAPSLTLPMTRFLKRIVLGNPGDISSLPGSPTHGITASRELESIEAVTYGI